MSGPVRSSDESVRTDRWAYDIERIAVTPGEGVVALDWRVRTDELTALRDRCFQSLAPVGRGRMSAGDPTLAILVPHLIQELMHAYRAYHAIERCARKPDIPTFDPDGWFYAAAHRTSPPKPVSPFFAKLSEGPKKPGLRSIMRRALQRILDRDGEPKTLLTAGEARGACVALARTPLILSRAKEAAAPVFIAPPALLLPESPASYAAPIWVEDAVEILVQSFGPVNGGFREALIEFLFEMATKFASLLSGYLAATLLAKSPMPAVLWTGASGSPWTMLLRAAVKEEGGRVVAFDHGSGHAIWDFESVASIEYTLVDEFVTFSEAMAELYSRNSRRFLLDAELPRMSVAGAGWSIARQVKSAARARRVLVVATPCMGERWVHIAPLNSDPVLVDWNVRLVSALSRMGFEPTVKTHPEAPGLGLVLARSIDLRVEARRFEDAIDDYEVALFDYPLTSTFAAAIVRGVPIVLIDHGLFSPKPAIADALADRVAMVEGRIEPDGRLTIDMESLPAYIDLAVARSSSRSLDDLYPRSYVDQRRPVESTLG